MSSPLPQGLYEQLVDEELRQRVEAAPELKVVLSQIDDEAAPQLYAQYINQLLRQAFRIVDPVFRY